MAPSAEDSVDQLGAKGAEATRQQGLVADIENDVSKYPMAKTALRALSDSSTGEIAKRQEASNLELTKETQRQKGRDDFWGEIEQQRAVKKRQQEEARQAAEEEQREARRKAEEEQRIENLRSQLTARMASAAAVPPKQLNEAYTRQQGPDAAYEGLSLGDKLLRKKADRDALERASAQEAKPLLAQSRAQADELARRARVAQVEKEMREEGQGAHLLDPSEVSFSDRFKSDSPELFAERKAMEQQSEADRLSLAADEGGARSTVTNHGIDVTDDYTSRVEGVQRDWRDKLLEEVPYTKTEEGLNESARAGEITSPNYYKGLAAYKKFQEERGTAERYDQGMVAFGYDGGREMNPEERIEVDWQSAKANIDKESDRRKRKPAKAKAGMVKDLLFDKHKVTKDLVKQTMSDIGASDGRKKAVKGALKSYMNARRGGVDTGLVRRPNAKDSVAPSVLPGADRERLETFLRERGALGKGKKPATSDLLEAYSMSASDFTKKRMGVMWRPG